MYFTVTPVSPEVSIAWTYVGLDYGDQTDEEVRSFQDRITRQASPSSSRGAQNCAARPPRGDAPTLGSHRRRLSHLARAWSDLGTA